MEIINLLFLSLFCLSLAAEWWRRAAAAKAAKTHDAEIAEKIREVDDLLAQLDPKHTKRDGKLLVMPKRA